MTNHLPPEIWPVIHLSTPDLAYRNAELAAACGCSGVFVIHMDGRDDEIDAVAVEIKARIPALKVGANYLTLPAHQALKRSITLGLDATWADAPGVRSDRINEAMQQALKPLLHAHPQHLFFGSVAFKYQPVDADPPAAARNALALGMIPTTSGTATGVAAESSKLEAMRAAIGDAPLAVASGMTADNANELGRFLTHILVSTGISKSFHEFDEQSLRRLVACF
jgi:hypothetical protein